jgi:hypothetical protein
MNEDAIPDEVRRLIAAHIDSVIVLEVLLLLYREPEREWSQEEVAQELRIEADWTQARLKELTRARLVCETGPPPHGYRYYPQSLDQNAAVAALARSYCERPLRVISYIYSKPSMILRRLVDTFRVRGWML